MAVLLEQEKALAEIRSRLEKLEATREQKPDEDPRLAL